MYVCIAMVSCFEPNDLSHHSIDYRLLTFDVDNIRNLDKNGRLSSAGQDHIRKILGIHQQATQAKSEQDALEVLADGVELSAPLGLNRQEQELCRLLQIELLVRYAGTAKQLDRPSEIVMKRLQMVLRPELPLPLDRVSADALIRLGDAAEASGFDGLAMGSYRRAIELMEKMSLKIVDEMKIGLE